MKRTQMLIFAVLCLAAAPACARDQIRIVGSSTVYPFVTEAAEEFGSEGSYPTPVVESTGTGGGFKLFCGGEGVDTPDINNASRAITQSESAYCAKNGVVGISEIAIGYDGIVIAAGKKAPAIALTKKQLFTALARDLPGPDGKLAPNPNHTWHDVDASLPSSPIRLFGPPPTSGTRDTFVTLVMEEGCKQVPAMKNIDPKSCQLLREDGSYIEAGEDFNMVVMKLSADSTALGVIGYNYYEENAAKVRATTIDGIAPSPDTIKNGSYGISRKLYVYVKQQHVPMVPGIGPFIRELTGEAAIGDDGYLTAKGLLPLRDADRARSREQAGPLFQTQ